MNIIDTIRDENLFRSFFGDLETWDRWQVALKALYGLPLERRDRHLVRQCTGRQRVRNLPPQGFDEACFIVGRRSGKSKVAAAIGAFEAIAGGHEKSLSPGEMGLVAVLAPTRDQSQIVFSYLRAIFSTPLLAAEVIEESKTKFKLRNGLTITVLTGDHRAARGYTLCCVIADELAFFGTDESARVKSDAELVRGILPSLATTGGKFIGITSPYMRQGYVYRVHKRHFGNDDASVLIWNCDSRTMNPTLPQSVVDKAMAEDMEAAKSEYLGLFRENVVSFIPRDMVESLVVPGRTEALPVYRQEYSAFFDASGGRSDSAVLAIAHVQPSENPEENRLVLDLVREWISPHSPPSVVREACTILEQWKLSRVTGDKYAASFCSESFRALGIGYIPSQKSASDIYIELLPFLCSGRVSLLDNPRLVQQLSSLERRTRSGGRDSIDHPPGGHDDVANAACGALINAVAPECRRAGVWGLDSGGDRVGQFIYALLNSD